MKQLRFTTTIAMPMLGIMNSEEDHSPLVLPDDIGEFIDDLEAQIDSVYIHGDAESLAGYDIPTFIDGNLAQLELPIEQQDILMMLPNGNYKCKAVYNDSIGSSNCYLITLFKEKG